MFLIGAVLLLLSSFPPLSRLSNDYSVAVVAASKNPAEPRVKPYREQHNEQQQQQRGGISESQEHFIRVQYCTS